MASRANSLWLRVKRRAQFILDNKQRVGWIVFVSYSSGCVVTFLAVSLMLLYANNGNAKSLKSLFVSIFIQLQLFRLRRRNRSVGPSFRITPHVAAKSIGKLAAYSDKQQYPFLRILPQTQPSNRFVVYDSLIFSSKARVKRSMQQPWSSQRVTRFRKVCRDAHAITTPVNPEATDIRIQELSARRVKCHWVAYQGASIDNGVILTLQGGGYIAGRPPMQYSLVPIASIQSGSRISL